MKTRLALLAAASLPAAGVVAFVLPGSRLPKSSCSTTTSPTTTTTTASTTASTTPRVAPLQVKADWFDRIPNAPEGADDGSMDDGMTSAQRNAQRKKDTDLAAAGDELRVAVRDAIWELDNRIHGMLPYDEADAEADPMYFLNALQHTLEGFGSDSKATTDANGRVSSSSSSSSSRNEENDITAMINKEIAMISSSTQDVFSKAQSSAAAMQASLMAAVEEGVKQANSASATLSAATADAPQQIKESAAAAFAPVAAMASSSVAERPAPAATAAAAAAVRKETAPVAAAAAAPPPAPVVKPASTKMTTTTRFCEEAQTPRSTHKKKGRSHRWVEERLPRSSTTAASIATRQPQQQQQQQQQEKPVAPAAVVAPVRPPLATPPTPAAPTIKKEPATTTKTTTTATSTATTTSSSSSSSKVGSAAATGGIPPRKRRDEEREEEQLRRKKAEAARAQAKLELQKMPPPPKVAAVVAPEKAADKKVVVSATPAAASAVAAAVAVPVKKEEKTPAPARVVEELSSLSTPKTIKRMTTGADRARGVMVVDEDDVLSVPSPTGATTVQEAMKQAQAKAKSSSSASSSTTKAVITTVEDLLVVPPPSPSTVPASIPPSLPPADEDLNPMPPGDRKSVEHILRDSKMAAVEEWHRTRSAEKDMSLEDKVLLVETRLVDEIRAGPSEAIMNYINVLEKIGEHQAAPDTAGAAVSAGNWDLAYSSAPASPFFSLPRLLARFLVGVSAKVEVGGKSVVYRAIFKFFDWFPRLRRVQKAVVSVSVDSPRKTVEVMSGRPRFTLGKLFSFVAPKLPSFGKKKTSSVPVDEPKLTNTCTYLGAHLKICRLARTPGVSAEPLLAVFLRGNVGGKAGGRAKVGGEMMEEEEEELLMFGQGGVNNNNSGRSAGSGNGNGKVFDRYGKTPKGGRPSMT